jgi:cobalt-zinc-cadmium efflux system membrane fusion protein
MLRRLCPLVFALLPACHKAPPAEPASPPAGAIVVTARQMEEARVAVEPASEREVGAHVVTGGRIAFDDLRVSHVTSPVTGRVTKIEAALGQHVKKGDPLATIDSPDLGVASSDLAKAEADVAVAERDFKRQKDLLAIKAVAERDVEAAEDNFRKAKAELERARQKARLLATAGSNVGQGFVLRALIDGEVVARSVSPGQEVQGQYAGSGPAIELFTLGDLAGVWAIADVYEMDIARVRTGQKVSIKVAAYPDKTFEGTVDWVSGTLDPATRTAKVRCTLDNAGRELKPEMFATLSIAVETRKRLAVPANAVVRLGEQTVVFVRTGEDAEHQLRFERRPVKLAEDLPGAWLPVLDGLAPGEVVVSSGAVLLAGS